MRLLVSAILLLSLPLNSHADETPPYGWNQCTTTFAGDVERCLDFVSNPCTSQERDSCLTNQATAWFAFGMNRMLRQSFAPASSGKRIDLKRLGRSTTKIGSFTEDCPKRDVECVFNSIITNVLNEHGPGKLDQ